MKIARQILYSPSYVSNYVLEKALENSCKYVDKVFIGCGITTWSYNKIHVQKYDMDFLLELAEKYNCELVFREAVNEETSRNHLLDSAKVQGFDFMLIQDPDEFLTDSSYQKLRSFLSTADANQIDSIKGKSLTYWKNWTNLLIGRTNQPSVWYPTFIVNLKRNFSFSKLRDSFTNTHYTLHDLEIHHGSYILTDEQMKEKISTWGHANDFDSVNWYNEKWLGWRLGLTKNLHPTHPEIWYDTILIDSQKLPKELTNWEYES